MTDEAQLTRSFSTLLSKKAGNAIARKFGGETGNSLTAHLISGAINTGAGMALGGVVGGIAGAVDENSDIGTGVQTGMTLGAVAGAGYSLGTSMLMGNKSVTDAEEVAKAIAGPNNMDGKGLNSKIQQEQEKDPNLYYEKFRKYTGNIRRKANVNKAKKRAEAVNLKRENDAFDNNTDNIIDEIYKLNT